MTQSVAARWRRKGVRDKDRRTNQETQEAHAKYICAGRKRLEAFKMDVSRGVRDCRGDSYDKGGAHASLN